MVDILPQTPGALVNYERILIRATNWVGDAVMSVPALTAIRERFPQAHISILAKSWVAGLYERETFADEVLIYRQEARWAAVSDLRARRFDCAILLQNAFEAALIAFLARIPVRIGYNRDGRGFLLTKAVQVPKAGEIPPHQRFYYLELLRRSGVLEGMPRTDAIYLRRSYVSADRVIGVSPGAAYGTAKQWLPERFAETALRLARQRNAAIALFGSAGERELCEKVAAMVGSHPVINHAGQTSLVQFIDLASQCELFITNDSGAMHIASALGVPTVAIFGATDALATGPTGAHARIVHQQVECSPCLLRECPIDHRCMSRVTADQVVSVALPLLETAEAARS